MAGESPDRSKQRESSAEPTSGSAGTVPESREPRDPRLAVARDGDAPRGGVDTATRVFAVRELEIERDAGAATGVATGDVTGGSADGSEEEPSGSRAEESADGPSEGAVGGSGEGPSRGSADGATGGSAEGPDDGPSDEPTDDVTDGPDGDAVAEVADGSAASLRDEPTGEVAGEPADGPADGSATALSDEPADDVADGPAGESPGDSGDDPADGPDGGPTSPAGDDTAADAGGATADSETATAGTAEAADALARPAGDGATRDADDAEPGTADDASGDAADATADAGDDVWPATGDDATRGFGTATARAAGTADDGTPAGAGTVTADADETAGGDSAEGAEEGPEGASEGSGEPGGESDASEGSEGADGGDERLPAAVARWVTPAKPYGKPAADEAAGGEPDTDEADTKAGTNKAGAKTGTDTDGAKTGADTDEADTKAGTNKAGAKTGADGTGAKAKPAWADSSPVDQPTAVFKAPRPKPAVDQPTTMLKLGGAAKPAEADKPDEATKPAEADKPEASAPEADRRTSKFVALKPDVTALVPQIGPERTTQQPLPPKPPLDLLAELTNTPPPPPTPLRTLGRRIKIWTPLVVLLLVVFAIAQAVRPLPATALELTAKDSYTFEGGKLGLPWPKEGQGAMDVNGIGTMDTFGDRKPVAIGSVAKAMTAYVVLKDHPLKSGEEGPAIPVDATAEKEGGYDKDGESTLNTVKEGDTLTERQALSAIMIPSANNIARLLARWDAGTEAEFIRKMNDTARELGMTNTTYTDASGLKETTVSTAADQVKLGNELVKIPALVEITRLPEWIDPSGQKWRNYNTLVPYNGAIGIKTGSTSKAGGNLLFAATKESGGETVTVVGAILGQHTAPIIDTVNAVSKTALLAARDAITSAKILKKGDVVGYVDDQLGGRTPVVVTKDVAAVGWAGLTVKLSFAADEVPHTAKAGTQVGTLTVGDGSSGAVKVPVALQSDLAEPGFSDKLTRIT
ncbi:D-alanyl-D-alanine carboxypeptidase [Streptomyces antibioticus]|uniref:D-alanyl-D-alanine carboxypeptidase n=1 Tax=Streptomyces antibioticus TaxID=1890 RepID=UPI0033C05845